MTTNFQKYRSPFIFLTQITFSGAVMAFSMAQIFRGKDTNVYIPIITGILGYWLPQPKYSHNKSNEAEALPMEGQNNLVSLSV